MVKWWGVCESSAGGGGLDKGTVGRDRLKKKEREEEEYEENLKRFAPGSGPLSW